MSELPIITVAKEFYNVFNPKIPIDPLQISVDSSGNKVAKNVESAEISFLKDLKYGHLHKVNTNLDEHNFIRVKEMRGQQLRNAIKDFDIISRYCHSDDCRDEQNRIEIILKKISLELIQRNLDLISKSDLIKSRAHGGRLQKETLVNSLHNRPNKLDELKKKTLNRDKS